MESSSDIENEEVPVKKLTGSIGNLFRAVDEEAGVVIYWRENADGLACVPLTETDLQTVEESQDDTG